MSYVYTRCLDCSKLYCYKEIVDRCIECGSHNLIDEIYDEVPENCNNKKLNTDYLVYDTSPSNINLD